MGGPPASSFPRIFAGEDAAVVVLIALQGETIFLSFFSKSLSAQINLVCSAIGTEILRWESLVSRATPLPQDDNSRDRRVSFGWL
jgi:hypothetical protein